MAIICDFLVDKIRVVDVFCVFIEFLVVEPRLLYGVGEVNVYVVRVCLIFYNSHNFFNIFIGIINTRSIYIIY